MRRIAIILAIGAVAAGLAAWATAATDRAHTPARATSPWQNTYADRPVVNTASAPYQQALVAHAAAHEHTMQMPAGMHMDVITPALATKLAAARLATAKYVTNLARAKADGYRSQITQMMPDMGYHFLNPNVKGFDVTKPPILVYEKRGDSWQLGAFEWVFPERPKAPPLPGATYGSFGAACHYVDGTFVFQSDQNACAKTSPKSGAAFSFWHPDLVTLHVWLWYPNPDGTYAGMNPLVHPFNAG